MKKESFCHRRDQGMANPSEHAMIRPNGQRVFPGFLQLLGVMDHHLLSILWSNVELIRQGGIELPFAVPEFGNVNIRIGCRMITLLIHKENRMEDLHGLM